MYTRNQLFAAPPFEVEKALKTLGADLRTARLRRNLSLADMAQKIGVTRQVIADAEKGKPTTSIAVYAGVLWALGLLGKLADALDPAQDEEGSALDRVSGRKHARASSALSNDF